VGLRALASSSSGSSGDFTTAVSFPIETVTTNTTLDATHYSVLVDDSGGSKTITLPAAAVCDGRIYNIKKLSASNTTTIDGNASETIDGATTLVLTTRYQTAKIQSDGTNWYLL